MQRASSAQWGTSQMPCSAGPSPTGRSRAAQPRTSGSSTRLARRSPDQSAPRRAASETPRDHAPRGRPDRGCMLVADAKNDRIEPRVVVRRPGLPATERFPVSRSIVQYVIQKGVAVRTSDASHDDRFSSAESIVQSGIREALCAPMFGRYELLGVLYVDITTSGPEWASRNGPRASMMITLPSSPPSRVRPLRPSRASAIAGARRIGALRRDRPHHRRPQPPHQEHPSGDPRGELLSTWV